MVRRDKRLVRLTSEHHKALVLSLKMERDLPGAPDADVQAIYEDVLAFWQVALLRHFRAENECLVTRLSRHVPLEDELIGRLCRDHIRLEALIVRMRDDDDAGTRREALREFGEVLREHVHWEEDILFERTQELLEDKELTALGTDLEEILPAELNFPLDRLYPRQQRNPRLFK